jgi:hypothetical protein
MTPMPPWSWIAPWPMNRPAWLTMALAAAAVRRRTAASVESTVVASR